MEFDALPGVRRTPGVAVLVGKCYLGVPHSGDGVAVQAVGHQLQLRGHHNQALESFQQILQRVSNHLQETVVPKRKGLLFLQRDHRTTWCGDLSPVSAWITVQ